MIGKEKVWCLAFVDDLVTFVKDDYRMKEIKKCKDTLKEREVNVE